MYSFKILITCPPMIKQIDRYHKLLVDNNLDYYCPPITQSLSEYELLQLVPHFDGWIIGDDPVTKTLLYTAINNKLKAAVKWGVGTDNIDYNACRELGFNIPNTPNMFGNEVADIAIGYLIGLARDLFIIDSHVKLNKWIKPTGISLTGKKVCLIGFGDIGRNIAKRLLGFNMHIWIVDPGFNKIDGNLICNYDTDLAISRELNIVTLDNLTNCLKNADFVIVACNLNKNTYHMLNKEKLLLTNKNLRLINVSRGSIIKEDDVIELEKNGHIYGVAFDVFESEPLSINNKLREFNTNIFGTHNGSNTIEAVDRTSIKSINLLCKYLNNNN